MSFVPTTFTTWKDWNPCNRLHEPKNETKTRSLLLQQMGGMRVAKLMTQISDEERTSTPTSAHHSLPARPAIDVRAPEITGAPKLPTTTVVPASTRMQRNCVLSVSYDQDVREETTNETHDAILQDDQSNPVIHQGWPPRDEDPTMDVCRSTTTADTKKKERHGDQVLLPPQSLSQLEPRPRVAAVPRKHNQSRPATTRQPSRTRSLPAPQASTTYYPPPNTFFHRERSIKIFDRSISLIEDIGDVQQLQIADEEAQQQNSAVLSSYTL